MAAYLFMVFSSLHRKRELKPSRSFILLGGCFFMFFSHRSPGVSPVPECSFPLYSQDRLALETLTCFHDVLDFTLAPGGIGSVMDLFHLQVGEQNEKVLAHIHSAIVHI
jgi:hypothetical protein